MPIVVNGMSRSGGTLLVTLLDAHPDISMSYELYPHQTLENLEAKARLSGISGRGWRFLVKHTDGNRKALVRAIALEKMKRQGTSNWGLKGTPDDWPGHICINIIRNGLDVLASQLVTGSFAKRKGFSCVGLGQTWGNHVRSYKRRMVYQVRYEDLVREPEATLRELFDAALDIPFSDKMLNHTKQPLTIRDTEQGHISKARVLVPIDTKQVGRWRNELTLSQINAFRRGANGALDEFGYEPSAVTFED